MKLFYKPKCRSALGQTICRGIIEARLYYRKPEDVITYNFERKTIADGVNFTVIKTEKFKKDQIVVNFLLPLNKETAALNALLPLVMRHGCKELPDMTELNKKLKWLYGANIDGGIIKIGEVQVISVYCESLADKYALGDEKILTESAGILNSVIFDPALLNGCFKKEDVEIEKRNLNDQIESLLNDKRQYAIMRLKEEMCKNEPYGICELGDKESVLKITPESLTEQWKKVISTAKTEIIVIGSGSSDETEKLFADSFKKLDRSNLQNVETSVPEEVNEPKTVVEHMPVSQAKLVMGLRSGMVTPDNTSALRLSCAILGGSTQSKLFVNVREKMSLCYYCMSFLERQKGLVIINSGIEEKNFDKARDEILHQLDDMKNGSFTDDEIKAAKLSLKNSFFQVSDSGYSLAVYYLGHAMSGEIITPEEAAEKIMKVTREEVIAASQKIKLDTVYLLAGDEDGEKVND